MVKKCAYIFCKLRKNSIPRVWLKMLKSLVFYFAENVCALFDHHGILSAVGRLLRVGGSIHRKQSVVLGPTPWKVQGLIPRSVVKLLWSHCFHFVSRTTFVWAAASIDPMPRSVSLDEFRWLLVNAIGTLFFCWILHEILERRFRMRPKYTTIIDLQNYAATKRSPEAWLEMNNR